MLGIRRKEQDNDSHRTLRDRMDATLIDVPPGLTNVVVAETELGDVRGLEGFYHYREHSATELARTRSVEEVWRLLLDGIAARPPAGGGFRHARSSALRAVPDSLDRAAARDRRRDRRPDALAGLRARLPILSGSFGVAAAV